MADSSSSLKRVMKIYTSRLRQILQFLETRHRQSTSKLWHTPTTPLITEPSRIMNPSHPYAINT